MPEVVNVYSETQNMVELKPYMKVYYVHTWIISSEEFGNLIKIAPNRIMVKITAKFNFSI